MKKITTILAISSMLFLSACNSIIPAGYKGKVMGNSGFQPEVYPPSKVWISSIFPEERMYLVETTTKKYVQPVTVLLKDKLELYAEVVFRGRIAGSDANINTIFNDMPMNDRIVTTDEVYMTYGKMIVMNTAREVISRYNVDEVNVNYARITTELYQAIEPKLKGLPIEISDVTIGQIRYPKIVTAAIEKAKEKRMAIEEADARVQIRLTELKGKEEAAKTEYNIKMLEAKQNRDANIMISEGITPDLITLKRLELEKIKLEKWNGILPTTAVGMNTPMIFSPK